MLYPAILGSMLYDALQIGSYTSILDYSKLSIRLFYSFDYLHLNVDLDSDEIENATGLRIIFDAVISVLFGISYWYMSQTDNAKSMYYILAASTLMLVYVPPVQYRNVKYYVSKIVLVLIVLLNIFVSHKSWLNREWQNALMPFTLTVFYAFHVFKVARCASTTDYHQSTQETR